MSANICIIKSLKAVKQQIARPSNQPNESVNNIYPLMQTPFKEKIEIVLEEFAKFSYLILSICSIINLAVHNLSQKIVV